MKSKILKFLPRIIPHFPVILDSRDDIIRAEQSCELSYGMNDDPSAPKLPGKVRYIISLLFKIPGPSGTWKTFFSQESKTTWPPSAERIIARQDTYDRLTKAIQQFKTMDDDTSALMRYIKSGADRDQKNNDELEKQARKELISLVLHQWNNKIQVDDTFLESLDSISNIEGRVFQTMLFPDRTRLENSRKYIQDHVYDDVLLYFYSAASGVALWKNVKKLHEEIYKPEFVQMLTKGEWSPISFFVQHKILGKYRFRVAACKTNLGGVLPYSINPGRIVLLGTRESAENSDDFFNHLCTGADFSMDILTILVDHAHPGIRKIPEGKECPYLKSVKRPLY